MTVIRARSASISIHALREEGDERDGSNICKRVISIHALREEGDFLRAGQTRASTISIHALREEGDAPNSTPSTLRTVFLSTPSARRATERICTKGLPV
mgnify:FL=1